MGSQGGFGLDQYLGDETMNPLEKLTALKIEKLLAAQIGELSADKARLIATVEILTAEIKRKDEVIRHMGEARAPQAAGAPS